MLSRRQLAIIAVTSCVLLMATMLLRVYKHRLSDGGLWSEAPRPITLVAQFPPWALDSAGLSQLGSSYTDRSDVLKIEGSYAQADEEAYAYDAYFYGRGNGTFLECGALNGKTFTNTYVLENELGWKGVLIEISPRNYAGLVVNRPNAIAVNAGLCTQRRTVHLIDTGHVAVGGIAEFMSPQFIRTHHKHLDPTGDFSTLPAVQCMPLLDVLATVGMLRINFFVLDVEGAELDVRHPCKCGISAWAARPRSLTVVCTFEGCSICALS